MTKTLSDMSVTEAAEKAIETLIYKFYTDDVEGKYSWRPAFQGSFEEYLEQNAAYGDLSSGSLWSNFKGEGSEGTNGEWHAKVEAEYGGEGQGDEYWMVVSISDGKTARFFRKDGWYASYDGGYLDGKTYEVTPKEKLVTYYE
jgi:hypothetical protein